MNNYLIKEYLHRLQEENLIVEESIVDNQVVVTGLTYNSKEVKSGSIFICKGIHFKKRYLAEAKMKGAKLYISEQKYEIPGMSYMIVKDIRKVMGILAVMYYNNPSKRLPLVGITGTKGKSTTTCFIKSIMDAYVKETMHIQKETGIISTIETYDGVIRKESKLTTPEALELQEHLHNGVEANLPFMQIEVSSQALKYQRVAGVIFDTAVFLNIEEDHISPTEHRDFEDYFTSKLGIFKQAKRAIVNRDIMEYTRVKEACKHCEEIITFGRHKDSMIRLVSVLKFTDYIAFRVKINNHIEQFEMKMKGEFNVENALAAVACAYAYKIPLSYIKQGTATCTVRGRMECFTSQDGEVTAIVDYAHNKLSFEKLYASVKAEYPIHNIVTIFGCPGDKAFNRRYQLGEVASKYSDYIYITADDPGEEGYQRIASEIEEALIKHKFTQYQCIEHREEAISAAFHSVDVMGKTVIIVAGKGHERTQKYGQRVVSTKSDSEYVLKNLYDYDVRTSLNQAKIAH